MKIGGCSCGSTLTLIIVFILLQFGIFWYLVTYHHLFNESFAKLKASNILFNFNIRQATINTDIPPIQPPQIPAQHHPHHTHQTKVDDNEISDHSKELKIFPVKLTAINQTDYIHPESLSVVLGLLGGEMINVNFPDLTYRSPTTVRLQHPRIFDELPSKGYISGLKNPCWSTSEESDSGKLACLPYAYVLGQPKCGTSDLFERLKTHEQIIMPHRKEVRWFTRGEFTKQAIPHEGDIDESHDLEKRHREILLGSDSSIYTFTSAFQRLSRSIAHKTQAYEDLITLDGGPHTLWWPTQGPDGTYLTEDIPPNQLLREIQPNAKFVITLASPIKRMYSDYYFLGDDLKVLRPAMIHQKSAMQFHERVKIQINLFEECIDQYYTELMTQYQQLFSSSHPPMEASALANVTASIPRKYQSHPSLWFRASQMCAHDRHTFGQGGWGRITIGLYILYIEKWLEYFSPSQFFVLRLEDLDTRENMEQHYHTLFDFLNISHPQSWNSLLSLSHRNTFHSKRDPILLETEELLNKFYLPYNQLLHELFHTYSHVQDGFLWKSYQRDGQIFQSLHDLQVYELKKKETLPQKEPEPRELHEDELEAKQNHRPPPHHPHRNPHQEKDDDLQINEAHHIKPLMDTINERRRRQAQLRGTLNNHHNRDPEHENIPFISHRFDITNLPEIITNDTSHELDPSQFYDSNYLGKHLCMATFTMNIPQLKYLLYELGLPPDIRFVEDGNANAWHCLAGLYTMADAHPRSHVFAELKGKTTWLTPHFHPPLTDTLSSVWSREILDRLSENMLKVAEWLQRAEVPLNVQDGGGNTPLHRVATGGFSELTSFMIAHGADVNAVNRDRRTPLHYAAALGHAEVAGILIKGGSNVGLPDINGVTSLDIIQNPGPISAENSLKYLNITQRPARQIPRKLHPEHYPDDHKLGWMYGDGGYGSERLPGFETDMECPSVDQYFADEITGEEIFENYLARNAPVLVRGLLNNWKILNHSTAHALSEEFGDLMVQASDIPYSTKFGGLGSHDMHLSDYIADMVNHSVIGGKYPWYVFKGHPIPRLSESRDSLVPYRLCPLPKTIYDGFKLASPSNTPGDGNEDLHDNNQDLTDHSNDFISHSIKREIFVNAQWALGGEGTGAPVHFHNTAWAALLYGAKKWLIYPPHDMIMSNKQIYDFYEHDRLDFERRGAKPVTCVQTAGDVMIIPESWGHGVLNIQNTLAIATEFRHSVWRLRPAVNVVSHIDTFNNRKQTRKLE